MLVDKHRNFNVEWTDIENYINFRPTIKTWGYIDFEPSKTVRLSKSDNFVDYA